LEEFFIVGKFSEMLGFGGEFLSLYKKVFLGFDDFSGLFVEGGVQC
jgi:hypothetical protein